MKKVLITGGAGFTGRAVSKLFIEKGHEVYVLDNLSNGSEKNIAEFREKLSDFVVGDIKDRGLLEKLFKNNFDICVHLAAGINVQESIDNPEMCFEDNVVGTFNVLEECRKSKTKFVFMSSALVYDTMKGKPISENHPTRAASPYMASKIAGENLALSYYHSYSLPITILRPFSIYGPFQRSDTEGGVVSIYIKNKLENRPLEVFGTGNQSRDFIYVEDCAEFIYRAAISEKSNGEILNAGSGKDIQIKELAELISEKKAEIKFVKHHHPQAEIMKMACDSSKAKKLLNWRPEVGLKEGLKKTEDWIKNNDIRKNN